MRISKLIVVTGAVVFCAGFISVRAADADNAAQAAARAAVLAAMQDANVPAANPAPASAQPVQPVVASAPVQPAVVAPVVVTTNSPVTNNAAQAASLAAVKQALQTANARIGVAGTLPAAPALPVTASVAEQLQALNAKYQAGEISPVDYFNRREALLKNQ